jgi:hypothetical protein
MPNGKWPVCVSSYRALSSETADVTYYVFINLILLPWYEVAQNVNDGFINVPLLKHCLLTAYIVPTNCHAVFGLMTRRTHT